MVPQTVEGFIDPTVEYQKYVIGESSAYYHKNYKLFGSHTL